MTDEAPFLAAIHAQPADDAPRLVFADWLDERGEHAPAAFLRRECAFAALPLDDQNRPILRQQVEQARHGVNEVWSMLVARPPIGICLASVKMTNCGPRLTCADIAHMETTARLPAPLPADYRAFLLIYNGGEPSPNGFYQEVHDFDPTSGFNEVTAFVSYAPNETDPVKRMFLLQTVALLYQEHYADPDLAEMYETSIAIGWPSYDENCLSMSLAAEDYGCIYEQVYIEGLRGRDRIAPSFREFLAMLYDLDSTARS